MTLFANGQSHEAPPTNVGQGVVKNGSATSELASVREPTPNSEEHISVKKEPVEEDDEVEVKLENTESPFHTEENNEKNTIESHVTSTELQSEALAVESQLTRQRNGTTNSVDSDSIDRTGSNSGSLSTPLTENGNEDTKVGIMNKESNMIDMPNMSTSSSGEQNEHPEVDNTFRTEDSEMGESGNTQSVLSVMSASPLEGEKSDQNNQNNEENTSTNNEGKEEASADIGGESSKAYTEDDSNDGDDDADDDEDDEDENDGVADSGVLVSAPEDETNEDSARVENSGDTVSGDAPVDTEREQEKSVESLKRPEKVFRKVSTLKFPRPLDTLEDIMDYDLPNYNKRTKIGTKMEEFTTALNEATDNWINDCQKVSRQIQHYQDIWTLLQARKKALNKQKKLASSNETERSASGNDP